MKVSWSVNERLWKSGRAVWRNHFQPPAANILSAASLARQGFLTEVKFMHLGSYQDKILDISRIPLLDLVKLSNVSAMVSISSLTLYVVTYLQLSLTSTVICTLFIVARCLSQLLRHKHWCQGGQNGRCWAGHGGAGSV